MNCTHHINPRLSEHSKKFARAVQNISDQAKSVLQCIFSDLQLELVWLFKATTIMHKITFFLWLSSFTAKICKDTCRYGFTNQWTRHHEIQIVYVFNTHLCCWLLKSSVPYFRVKKMTK